MDNLGKFELFVWPVKTVDTKQIKGVSEKNVDPPYKMILDWGKSIFNWAIVDNRRLNCSYYVSFVRTKN